MPPHSATRVDRSTHGTEGCEAEHGKAVALEGAAPFSDPCLVLRGIFQALYFCVETEVERLSTNRMAVKIIV